MTNILKPIKSIIFIVFLAYFLIPFIAKAEMLSTPNIHGYVSGSNENDLAILITWDIADQNEYGYKLEKEGVKGKETAATYNPIELGDEEKTPGGFYLDTALVPNDTYTYYVTTFDRAGNNSETAAITLVATICQDDFTTFEGKVNGNTVLLSWNPLCSAVEYKLYRDNKKITITDQSSYEDKNVPEGEHEYKIEAYDQKISFENKSIFKKANAAPAPIQTKTTKVKIGTKTTKATTCAKGVNTEFGLACNLADYVNLILKWALPVVGGLAVLMIIYAGYIYMTSQGNPEAVAKAKDIIIGVAIGVLLLFLIGVILGTLGIT